jgi:hypothetical protein
VLASREPRPGTFKECRSAAMEHEVEIDVWWKNKRRYQGIL